MLRTHQRDCEGAACQGCDPCPEAHCRICGREHVTVDRRGTDQTCASCLGDVRTDLADIYRHAARLLGEAIVRGINSEAAVYAGPAANPENWGRRLLLIGRNGTDKEANAFTDDNRDEPHPTWVVGTWEMLVRDHLEQPSDEQITLSSARDYLDGHLTRLAHDIEFGFEEMAKELRTCRGRLEDLLAEGERAETGAPCPACGARALVKSYGGSEDDDRWTCPKCRQWWTEADYRTKVDGIYLGVADALTASQMQRAHRIPEGSTRAWAAKGEVRRRGRDDQGRTLYDVTDTLRMRDGKAS